MTTTTPISEAKVGKEEYDEQQEMGGPAKTNTVRMAAHVGHRAAKSREVL